MTIAARQVWTQSRLCILEDLLDVGHDAVASLTDEGGKVELGPDL